MPENIWSNSVDDGKYKCWVERTGAYTGILMVQRDGETVLQEEVSLAYQAIFGPDADDVSSWQQKVIAAIDADYAERGETPPE